MLVGGPIWIILSGVIMVGAYQIAGVWLAPRSAPNGLAHFALTEVGILGFALIATGVLVWFVNKTRKITREPPARILVRGALFGMVAGLIVSALFPPPDADVGPFVLFYRTQRILGFAALMGGGMYVMLQLVANASSSMIVSRWEQILALATGFIAVFVCGLWGSLELPRVGGGLCRATLGTIDWIGGDASGTGRCEATGNGAVLLPRQDIPQIAAAMLGFYFLFVTIYENGRWRLSFARSVIVIGGSVVAGFTLFEVVSALNAPAGWATTHGGRLLQFGPFLIGMGLYAALFSFWVTWSKHHSLVEALSTSFGSTDAFRNMVDTRLRATFDVPQRGASLFRDVRGVVDRAEDNGWVGGLIVNARRSRPEDVRLARIADGMGLGINAPAPENLAQAITHVVGAAKAQSETSGEKLETIIRQFSDLSPVDRRMLEARLEARICRIVTPRNEGTGWLVGPDLVLTNYHVVKDMVGENPSVRGRDVICQFDFKVAAGSTIKGTECQLQPEAPVVDYSPYSTFDLSDSEELPSEKELDFALLRLDRKLGELPIGGQGEDGAPKRGWISLKKALEAADPVDTVGETKMLLYVLQHPYGGPLKGECGAFVSVNANRTRVRHEATTERGSSGSPCFNFSNLEPFALHHAGKHSRTLNKPYNQAIPITRIMRYLRDSGKVEAFWDMSPGGADKPFERARH